MDERHVHQCLDAHSDTPTTTPDTFRGRDTGSASEVQIGRAVYITSDNSAVVLNMHDQSESSLAKTEEFL